MSLEEESEGGDEGEDSLGEGSSHRCMRSTRKKVIPGQEMRL